MNRAASSPWYADGLAFECRRDCGRCCRGPGGYVWVTEIEAEALAKTLGFGLDRFGEKFLRETPRGLALRDAPNGDCILLNPEGRCLAYTARPNQCRTFPWWPDILESREEWERAKRRCPGVGTGPRHALGEIEALRREAEARELP
jgi:uncharacterized protein